MDKNVLVIFHHPALEALVSTEVISQYDFGKYSKHVFSAYNIEVKYFYEYLPDSKRIQYENFDLNLSLDCEQLIQSYKNEVNEIFIEIESQLKSNPGRSFILLGWVPIGFDVLFTTQVNNILESYNSRIKRLLLMYDWHGFVKSSGAAGAVYHAISNNEIIIMNDQRLTAADLIISPTISYFYDKNVSSNYLNKIEYIPFSYNISNKFLFTYQKFEDFFNRKPVILLSGATGNYPYRMVLANIYDNQTILSKDEFVGNADEFRLLIDCKNTYTNRFIKKFKESDERGITYIKTISQYQGSFVLFAKRPIDFLLTKIFEIMLAGAIAFIEPNKALQIYCGFQEYVHYVPVLIDENKKMVLDVEYYKKYLGTSEGLRIAKNGFEYVRDKFTDENLAIEMCALFKKHNFISE